MGCGAVDVPTGRQFTGQVVDVLFRNGHSNCGGTNIDPNGSNSPPPTNLPNPGIDFLRRGLVANETISDTGFVSLRVTTYGGGAGVSHGAELAEALAFAAKVDHVAVLKVWGNGTRYTDWVEGGPQNAALQTAIADFKQTLTNWYPGATSFRWHRVVYLGTIEGNTSKAACDAMPALAATLRTQTLGYIGIGSFVDDLTIRESINIVGQPFLSDERINQALIGTMVNIDDLITVATQQSDGRHYTGQGHNLIGGRTGPMYTP